MKTKIVFALIAVLVIAWAVFATKVPLQADESHREEYFLIRTLEILYEQWPRDAGNPKDFSLAAEELRIEAIRLKVRAEQAELHSSVIDGYTDFVAQLDAYTTFLSNIGAIQKAAKDQAKKENIESGFHGGWAAAGTYSALSSSENVSGGKAAVGALIVGGITCAIESWQKAGARDEVARNAVNAEAQRIQDQLTATLERSRQRFTDLAQSKGWGKHEIGWDLSPDSEQAIDKIYQQGDLKGITAELSRQRTERPNDPFVAFEHNLFQVLQNLDNSAELARLTEDSYSLKSLIPADGVYDKYRLKLVTDSAFLASEARYAERMKGALPQSSDLSRRAVKIWEEVYRLEPSDSTGKIRMNRAMAYAADDKMAKACNELKPIYDLLEKDGEYRYACAWILCLDGNYDLSLELLKYALHTDSQDLVAVRNDPNLADLKKHKMAEFQKLTTPQFQWNFENGILFANV